MSNVIGELFASMDMVAFRHAGDDQYEAITQIPDWFALVWPECFVSRTISIRGPSPFVDNFIHDAAHHWGKYNPEMIKSGPFIEVTSTDETLALEASATSIDKERILIISNLGTTYEDTLRILQAARENLLTQETLEIEVSKRTQEIRQREAEVAGRLIYAAGFRDEETGAHIRRIGLYAAEMGKRLGWSQHSIDDIRIAAPMHDIGKIGTPDEILKKPGRLTPEEFEIMKNHARIGFDILDGSDIPMIQLAAEIAGSHHEYWDGSGYPHSLKGEDIPMSARIVAIVDVYDALVHKRVYKEAIDEPKAIDMLRERSGTQFDPALLELFIRNLAEMRAIRETIQD